MGIVEQQVIADKVLALVEKCDPMAIIAGGAPRDWYLGVGANDIDIFCYLREDITVGRRVRWLEKNTGLVFKDRCPGKLPEQYKMNPHLAKVLETEVEGMPVQVMIMNNPTCMSVVEMFPFSICKAWYKSGKIHLTRDFKLTMESGIIFKTGETYSDEHRYVLKIKDRFTPIHTPTGHRFIMGSKDSAEKRVLDLMLDY